jgi:hypothetical protein
MPKAYLCGKLGIPALFIRPFVGCFGDSLTKSFFGENWGARRGHLDGSRRVDEPVESSCLADGFGVGWTNGMEMVWLRGQGVFGGWRAFGPLFC